jgi:hypothetical protein
MVRNIALLLLISVFVPAFMPRGARADNSRDARKEFQLRLDDAYHSMVEGRSGKKRIPLNVVPGEKYHMNCSPEKLSSQDRKFTISFEDIDVPKNFSLVFVDELRKILVVAGTAYGAYIDDNTIQPELIKKNSIVTTKPLETYGHMDDTGYPYGAFGPRGTYAILLVDDAIDFEMHRGVTGRLITDRGKVPNVIAGCAVTWTGN